MIGWIRAMTCAAALAVVAGGCADNSGRVPGWDESTVRGPHGQKLSLVKPHGVDLERGEAETVTVQLEREDFNQAIEVTISRLPGGVVAVDAPRRTSSNSVQLVLRARDDADLVENHQALVTAVGPDGMQVSETLEITVRERS